MSDINKELAELLGLHWHEGTEKSTYANHIICSCGFTFHKDTLKRHIPLCNPDFTTDSGKIELLRLMKEVDNWDGFLLDNGALSKHSRSLDCIQVDFITDTTGLLAQAAVEFLRKEAV